MRLTILKILIMVLMFEGSLVSCSEKNDDIDPEKLILGKWELVLLTRNMGEDEIQHTPTGYIEYLPDNLMAWYDYATKEYTLLESKYWLEEDTVIINDIPNKHQLLHYQDLWIELRDGKQYCLYPDFQGCNLQSCTFFSNDRMGLHQLCAAPYIEDYTYVYERKK